MLLSVQLEKFTKDELLNYAYNFDIKRCSKLRKKELVEHLVSEFCTEEKMRNRLTCLTKEQLEMVRRACVMPQEVSVFNVSDTLFLCLTLIGWVDETEKFHIYEEVASIFKTIDDEEFKAEQYQKGWLMKCLYFFKKYYGIAPVETVFELYKLKIHSTIDEMMALLDTMPSDLIECTVCSMQRLGMQDWPSTDPIYSKRGILVHDALFFDDDEDFDDLLSKQMGKQFAIPSIVQINELYKFGYERSLGTYQKLEAFLIKRLSLDSEDAFLWAKMLWNNVNNDESPALLFNQMHDAGIIIEEKDLQDMLDLIVQAHNTTRLKTNRGARPLDLTKNMPRISKPTIVPVSSNAAELLEAASAQLKEMGVNLNLDAPTVGTKKVYPNDPCPCGSGKKFKKCCGRK